MIQRLELTHSNVIEACEEYVRKRLITRDGTPGVGVKLFFEKGFFGNTTVRGEATVVTDGSTA